MSLEKWSEDITQASTELAETLDRVYELIQYLCDQGMDGIAWRIVNEKKRKHAAKGESE